MRATEVSVLTVEEAQNLFFQSLKNKLNGAHAFTPADLISTYNIAKFKTVTESYQDSIRGDQQREAEVQDGYEPTSVNLRPDQLAELTVLAVEKNKADAFAVFFEQSKSDSKCVIKCSQAINRHGGNVSERIQTDIASALPAAKKEVEKNDLLGKLNTLEKSLNTLQLHYDNKKSGWLFKELYADKSKEAGNMLAEISALKNALNNNSVSAGTWSFESVQNNSALKDGKQLMADAVNLRNLQADVSKHVTPTSSATTHK